MDSGSSMAKCREMTDEEKRALHGSSDRAVVKAVEFREPKYARVKKRNASLHSFENDHDSPVLAGIESAFLGLAMYLCKMMKEGHERTGIIDRLCELKEDAIKVESSR